MNPVEPTRSSPLANAKQMLFEQANTREKISKCVSCVCLPLGCPVFCVCDILHIPAVCLSSICCPCCPKCSQFATRFFQAFDGNHPIQSKFELWCHALLPAPCLDVCLDTLDDCKSDPSTKLSTLTHRHKRLVSRYMLPAERAVTAPRQQKMSLSIAADAFRSAPRKATQPSAF